MPYYIYKITPGPTDLLKTLEKLEQYDSFKEAKKRARSLRAEMAKGETHSFKVMFADSELEAEEKLMEMIVGDKSPFQVGLTQAMARSLIEKRFVTTGLYPSVLSIALE